MAKKMKKKSPRSSSQSGKIAKSSGKTFERKIARILREIYDGLEFCAELAQLKGKEATAKRKQSLIQRGDQSEGAKNPDIIAPGRWWFELSWKFDGSGRADRSDKLEQAECDVVAVQSDKTPVVIWAKKGSPKLWVTMRAGSLVEALTPQFRGSGTMAATPSPLYSVAVHAPVVMPFDEFRKVLEQERDDDARCAG